MEHKDEQLPVEVRDLHKSFGSQKVLNGIDLEVKRGETLAVMGRSGTGKSVLLKLLIGLQSPDSGSVCIGGQRLEDLRPEALNQVRRKVGFLFQQAALYDSMTIEENVLFPMMRHHLGSPNEQRSRARRLLAEVGIENDGNKLPSQISGGMQKRAGLARALALDPEILLFDEPTAGLDPITAGEIGNLIVDLKKQRHITSIVVTHDVHGARAFADRLVLISKGKIVADGTFADLQASQDRFVGQFLREAA